MGGKESASSSSPTPEQVYRCKRLVFCTGKHASPNLPAIPKDDGSVPTLHSSQVQEWDSYKGKRVVVVGAGASGLDLVINSLQVRPQTSCQAGAVSGMTAAHTHSQETRGPGRARRPWLLLLLLLLAD